MHLHLVYLTLFFLCQNIGAEIIEEKSHLAKSYVNDTNGDVKMKNPINYIHQYTSKDREQKRVLNRKTREEIKKKIKAHAIKKKFEEEEKKKEEVFHNLTFLTKLR